MNRCPDCEGEDSLCALRERYADEGRCYDLEEFGECQGCIECEQLCDAGEAIYCECGLYVNPKNHKEHVENRPLDTHTPYQAGARPGSEKCGCGCEGDPMHHFEFESDDVEEGDCCCQGDKGHDGPCCPGWAHFNEEQLPDGRIISEIMGCDDCSRFAIGNCTTDDEAALVVHDAICTYCREPNGDDDIERLPGELRRLEGTEDVRFVRITKNPQRPGFVLCAKYKEE